ncbi:MAG: hypothetical protein IKU01_01125, partial [Bacteroidales bacterium]|nr:hypothetical protein [Bacteroidales bacterium]
TPSHQVAENLSVTSPQTTSESQYLGDSASFHESQIRIADSLYKNYLPQYNFDEVKAAMEFYDSIRNEELAIRNYGRRKAIPNSTFLIPNYQCAKAHYYHAVGLTEKDDIVGACEHYLIALEIMEEMMANDKSLKAKGKKSVDNPENYEKIRFIYLIHTRLGEIFYDANYCDISIANNKKALNYSNNLNNTLSTARTYKYIGNSYQLLNNVDSALYYYNKSLKTSENTNNKLDVEKCIAQIMYFHKYEFDSAFMILKNNLNKIDNENVKYSYHYTLGNMYYNNKSYDSALYYLEESLDNNIITKKLAFTTTLSAIYDSIGDYEKKAYYDNLSSKLFFNNINKEVDKSKLQVLYNDYNERKADKEITTAKKKARNKIIAISIIVLVVVTFVIIYIRYNHKKQNDKLKKEIDGYANDIDNKDIIISQKEQLVGEYKKAIEKKDEIIKKQSNEIQNYIYEKEQVTTMDFESYYNCNICKKILNEKEERYTALSAADLSLLVDSANENLNNILKKLKELYPQLNNNDMYYICLSMLNISVNGTSYLMGRTRKTVWLRIKTIKSYMNLKDNDDLLTFLKTIR